MTSYAHNSIGFSGSLEGTYVEPCQPQKESWIHRTFRIHYSDWVFPLSGLPDHFMTQTRATQILWGQKYIRANCIGLCGHNVLNKCWKTCSLGLLCALIFHSIDPRTQFYFHTTRNFFQYCKVMYFESKNILAFPPRPTRANPAVIVCNPKIHSTTNPFSTSDKVTYMSLKLDHPSLISLVKYWQHHSWLLNEQ